jgi:Uma2 family endonuclease
MTLIQSTPLSLTDWARLEDEAGVEFVDGQILEKPVSVESVLVESKIQRLVGNYAEATRLGRVFTSAMGYRCYPEDPLKFRKPDVSFIREERFGKFKLDDGFITFPADLVVEVVSPNDTAYEIDDKVKEYLGHGFPLIWIVHPNTRTVIIRRADRSITLLYETDEITGESALPGFKCKVSEFFADLGALSVPDKSNNIPDSEAG